MVIKTPNTRKVIKIPDRLALTNSGLPSEKV
jgi:hypothetical protein